MADQFDWSLPPLDAENQRLVEAYRTVGRPLDDLVYTPEFDRLVHLLGAEETLDSRHFLYRRLLNLQKRGRLSRVNRLVEQ